jgi:hypothetical protein
MELLGYNIENLTADHSCECIRRVSCTMATCSRLLRTSISSILSKLLRNEERTGQTEHQNLTVTELGRDETFNLLQRL